MKTVHCPNCNFAHIIFRENDEKIKCTNCGNIFDKNNDANQSNQKKIYSSKIKIKIREFLKNGQKLNAIEYYKNVTGSNLVDSSIAIENIEHENGVFKRRNYFLRYIIFAIFVILGSIIAYLVFNKPEQIPITPYFTDERDGKIYKTILIGNLLWMADNLSYKTNKGSSWFEDDSTKNSKFGRLYDWETAQKVAPKGWHVPTLIEFKNLFYKYDEFPINEYKNFPSIDSSGFNVKYFGWRSTNGNYEKNDTIAYFWTSTNHYSDHGWGLEIISTGSKARMKRLLDIELGFSVRCVRDY